MRNILKRLEKRMIIKNTYFIKNFFPRKLKKSSTTRLSFKGENTLKDMVDSSNKIFKDFNSMTSVLIKINLNSANPYPASTSREMLDVILNSLFDLGVKKICIGDCSGLIHLPTREVIKKKGLYNLKKYGIKIKVFDYGRWIKIAINGVYFENIILSESIYKYDKIINLANLKSHNEAGFSFATKSLVGFMHPCQRFELHRDHIEEKIAELSLAVQPDINIVDARSIFVDGGPDIGTVAEAKTIIINNNLLEADLSAYNLLSSFKQKSGMEDFDHNPYNSRFFKHLIKITGEKL